MRTKRPEGQTQTNTAWHKFGPSQWGCLLHAKNFCFERPICLLDLTLYPKADFPKEPIALTLQFWVLLNQLLHLADKAMENAQRKGLSQSIRGDDATNHAHHADTTDMSATQRTINPTWTLRERGRQTETHTDRIRAGGMGSNRSASTTSWS